MAASDFRVELLTRQHDRSTFTCGAASLDHYFHHQARQDAVKGVASVYVLVESTQNRIAGFYTLNAAGIPLNSLPARETRKLPRYADVPVTLLGRLAIDEAFRGRHLGHGLLVNACQRVKMNSREIATWAVIVDALDDNARAFYERFGFLRLLGNPHRLFLPLSMLESVLPDAQE